jgi:hypothetical protein
MIRKIGLSVLLALALPVGAWAASSIHEQLGAPSLHGQLQGQQRQMDLPMRSTTALPSMHEQLGAPSLQEHFQRQQQDQFRVQHQLPPQQ